MNWGLWIGSIILGVIGLFMIKEGGNTLTQVMGNIIFSISAVLGYFAVGLDTTFDHPGLDKDKCVQYVQLEGKWTCVPWEEAG